MAYKFQRGAAILSGSIKAEDGLVSTDVDATTADFVVAALTAGDIPFSKLAIADAKILIGDNANGHAQEFALSGDVTMTAGGVVTIAADSVEGTMLNTNAADGSTMELSSDSLSVLKVPSALTAGNGLAAAGTFDGAAARSFAIDLSGSANGLNVNADGLAVKLSGSASGLAIDAGGLTVDADPDSFSVSENGIQLAANVAGSALSLASGQLSVANLANAQIASNAAIGLTKLAAVSAASVVMGNASNQATATAISGDISLANNGAVTLAAAQTNISSVYNAALIVGRGASDAHIDFGTDNQIQFDIDNAATMNLSANGINVQQGGIQVPAGADVDVAGAGAASLYASVGANNLTLGGASSTVIVAGNLTVQGTTTSVDSTTINISSSFTFEGPADDHETILTCATPGADTTLSLPTLSAGSYFIPALADAATDASAAVTAAEFALLDGDTSAASSITVADADRMIINDAGTMKQIAMSDVKSYVAGASTLAVASKADGNALEEDKVNFFGDLGANATVTLPASAAGLIGKSVYIKAKDLTSGATIIINTQAADQKIDGENSIILESPYASVRLVYVATNDWRVF